MTRTTTLLLATMAAACALLNARPASACSPEYRPGVDDIQASAYTISGLPKNLGIPFQVFAGANVDDAAILARLHIKIKKGDAVIEGGLARVEGSGARSTYLWKPTTGDLPVGSLTLEETVTTKDKPEQTANPVTFTVEDRTLVAADMTPTLEVTRQIIGDAKASTIVCKRTAGGGECASGEQVRNIATHQIGVPSVHYALPAVADGDQQFVRATVTIYGKNADGTKSAVSGELAGSSSSTNLDRAYEQYCVESKTSLLGVTAAPVVKTVCEARVVDLTVSSAEANETIKSGLVGCDSTVYPTGSTAENPTGEPVDPGGLAKDGNGKITPATPAATDDGGCSVGHRTTAPAAELALAMLGLVLVIRRRRRA